MNRYLLLLTLFSVQDISAQDMSWITACAAQEFCLNQNICAEGTVYLVEKAVTNCGNPNVNYSFKIDLNGDNIPPHIQSSDDTVSMPLPKGTHRITWKATDNCGNLIQCTYTIKVKDCQPPNLLCINGLTQGLSQPNCSESFSVSQFILSLADNCTPKNQIQLGIRKAGDGIGFPTDTSLTFVSCEKGFNSIEVWAKDGNGLTNLCSNYVIIQDGNNDCACNKDADLYFDGCARTISNTKLSNFKLKTAFESLPGAVSPLVKNYSQTIEDSCFTLHLDKIPFGADYQANIHAERTSGPLVGVTTYDLVLISKHILAIEPFTSIYQTVAADVNKSGSVTTFDIVETRKLILGIYDTFPHVPAWRITRPVANPSQIANFGALKDTYQITLPNLVGDLSFPNLNFVGIKYGDVNGSAFLTGEQGADDRYTAPPILLRAEDLSLKTGEEITLAFTLAESLNLEGWQIALEADPARIQILEANGLPADHFSLRGSEFRALWDEGMGVLLEQGKSLFELKIKALQATKVSEGLLLNSEKLRPEAYAAGQNSVPERHPLMLHFGDKIDGAVTFFPPHPNPLASETTFEMLLQNPGVVYLDVFDLNGRHVFSNTYTLESGLQTIPLSAAQLPEKGVYAYRLKVGDAAAQGRLVRI